MAYSESKGTARTVLEGVGVLGVISMFIGLMVVPAHIATYVLIGIAVVAAAWHIATARSVVPPVAAVTLASWLVVLVCVVLLVDVIIYKSAEGAALYAVAGGIAISGLACNALLT